LSGLFHSLLWLVSSALLMKFRDHHGELQTSTLHVCVPARGFGFRHGGAVHLKAIKADALSAYAWREIS